MKSREFQLGSSSLPKIKPGGSSSSTQLNRFNKAVSDDLALLTNTVQKTVEDYADFVQYSYTQAAGFQSVFSAIESRIQTLTASGISKTLADVSSTTLVDSDATTAAIAKEYGQATLPIQSSTNLLVVQDVYGDNYVPEGIRISYGITDRGQDPSEWISDPKAIDMLKGDGPWIKPFPLDRNAGEIAFFIRLEFPYTYSGLEPNVLEFNLAPTYLANLVSLKYQSAISGPGSSGTDIDFSYLVGYNEVLYGNQYVNQIGPSRVFLPKESLRSITLEFHLDSNSSWGLGSLALKHLEFEESAQLKVQNPLGSISGIYLKGKDENDLADLSYSIDSTTCTVQMSNTDPFYSPVITGVVLE